MTVHQLCTKAKLFCTACLQEQTPIKSFQKCHCSTLCVTAVHCVCRKCGVCESSAGGQCRHGHCCRGGGHPPSCCCRAGQHGTGAAATAGNFSSVVYYYCSPNSKGKGFLPQTLLSCRTPFYQSTSNHAAQLRVMPHLLTPKPELQAKPPVPLNQPHSLLVKTLNACQVSMG